jgi:uncharacterized protein (DUF362 family)
MPYQAEGFICASNDSFAVDFVLFRVLISLLFFFGVGGI